MKPRFIVEYLRRSDLDAGWPEVHVRHSAAETASEAEEQTKSADPDDILFLSVDTVESYRDFLERILDDPECSVEALLNDKTNDD